MKALILFEEIAMFFLALFAFASMDFSWWLFPALLLAPDISMIGYAAGNRFGAILYNIFHHKAFGGLHFYWWFLPAIKLDSISRYYFIRSFFYG